MKKPKNNPTCEYRLFGKHIIQSVGLPIVNASELLLGESAIGLADLAKKAAESERRRTSSGPEKLELEAEKLVESIDHLRKKALSLNAKMPSYSGLCHAGGMKTELEKMAEQLLSYSDLVARIIKPTLAGEIWQKQQSLADENLTLLIGSRFLNEFRWFFGEKATTRTYDDEEEAVDGPFIRFSRAILERAGVSISNAAIARYPSRARGWEPSTPWFLQGDGPKQK